MSGSTGWLLLTFFDGDLVVDQSTELVGHLIDQPIGIGETSGKGRRARQLDINRRGG